MDLGLEQKRVVITGSSRGIGFALAQAFLEEGSRVLLNGLDERRLQEAQDRLAGFGDRVTAVAADVSRRSGVERLFEEIDVAC
jgi:NAD(P)-dependent dehydrogenase (short-subunit alcohol dehydrogenase family)